jgi:TolA-binding protein
MKRSVKQAIAATVIGLGVTGGVVLAQTPTTPVTGTTTTPGTTTTQPTNTQPSNANGAQAPDGAPNGPGQFGPGGRGPGGPGGHGPGGMQAPTTASVTTQITNLTQAITSAKADRDFANGKMDLTTVNSLIDKASALQTQAQTALTANNLTLASGDARAADEALHSADDLIVASIGTTGLPSAANRPARPAPTTPTADQQKARSSNELAHAYQDIVNTTNTVKANSTSAAGDLSFYVTTAQGLYKQAYDLYNAGKYDQASQTVRAAQNVGHIADELLRAAGVTPTGPQTVTVPAPNF